VTCEPTHTPDDIDIPALREKYRRERDRRLRPEGNEQYFEVTGDYAEFYETDPYSPPPPRDPISQDVDVAVLGGGFAGLLAATRLKQAGVTDLLIIEMGGDFGGTWYWNRYPGIQCDVEAYSYLPLLEDVNYMPKERYSFGPEIFEHCQRIGRHFGHYAHALFGTNVRALAWNQALSRWRITTGHGDDIRARMLIMASGAINRPKLPGIQGIKNFKGRAFHTSRWDYDYTGGNAFGGLTKLADKHVAIIGTGSTAVQCVPHLGRDAKHLFVFQRTPSYVDDRGNRPTDPAWVKSLKPGWQAERRRNFDAGSFGSFSSPEEDIICDGWSEIARNLAAKRIALGNPSLTPQELAALREVEDHRAMERLRRKVDATVKDKTTAEALKPWYRFLCKRPCFNDDYLPAFNRPNVTLVDVSGSKGVERITEKGLVANGAEYEVDLIVYASGFEVTTDSRRRYGIPVIDGRDGLSLYEHWSKGFRTLHGMTSHGFPNQFFTGFTQLGISANITGMFDQQASHIAYIIKETLARGAVTVEPTAEAQDAWVATIRENLALNAPFWQACTPGYYNNEGIAVNASALFGQPYGKGFYAFDQLLKTWRESGKLEGLVFGT
jgi:cation diffusion facilitator CzcD-associated flavoprotein CzcO